MDTLLKIRMAQVARQHGMRAHVSQTLSHTIYAQLMKDKATTKDLLKSPE